MSTKVEYLKTISAHTKDLHSEQKLAETAYSQASILKKFINNPPDIPMSCKALGNLCLGFALENTEEEGWRLHKMAEFYVSASSYLKKNGLFSTKPPPQGILEAATDLVRHGDSLATPKDLATKTLNDLQNLKVGKSLVISSGWVLRGQEHAVLLRLERTGRNTFDLYCLQC